MRLEIAVVAQRRVICLDSDPVAAQGHANIWLAGNLLADPVLLNLTLRIATVSVLLVTIFALYNWKELALTAKWLALVWMSRIASFAPPSWFDLAQVIAAVEVIVISVITICWRVSLDDDAIPAKVLILRSTVSAKAIPLQLNLAFSGASTSILIVTISANLLADARTFLTLLRKIPALLNLAFTALAVPVDQISIVTLLSAEHD